MIVVPRTAPASRRWLAHLVRAAEGVIRAGDPFDDDLSFEEDAVLRGAVRQRVAPLLHAGLRDGRIGDPLPASFARACERFYYATIRRNVVALEAGGRLLGALRERRVAAVPIKGWAFLEGAAPLHPDPGTRPMDDLDLMVRPADRERAEGVLAERGWRRVTRRPAALRGGHELAFHAREAGVDLFVELHWAWAGPESLMRGFGVSGDRFLDELCEPGPSGALEPTRTGHLLFGAVHAARHTFERWIWLVDLHRLVTAAPVDWDALLAAARRWRVSGPLYAGLATTRELLRTPIPAEFLAALAPGRVRRRLLVRSLAASTREGAGPGAAWTAKLLLGETWWEVARTAAWAAAPGPDWYEARGRRPGAARRLAHPLRLLRNSAEER